EIQDEGRTVVIDHEEMPGYMGAMIMHFRVKNPAEVEGVSPGDEIQFTYQVAELSSWIEDLKTTGKKVEVNSPAPKSTSSSKLLKVGDPLPDFELLDEQGKPIQLSDYRGSVVALTFVFTRCPVPEYCPTMMRNFHEVDELLKADSQSPENYQLLTVSFDPEFDTPEVLKAYAEPFKQDSSNWDFLSSSSQASVKSLGEAVGLKFGKSKTAIYSHNLRTVVLDESGKITKIFTDETWKPEELVREIKSAADDS
ncbi:MAG: SCO family protein, partial [Verrucomicrobia bacterium]|nr:SCO family protein [Verrucomicrobiota bacterium]